MNQSNLSAAHDLQDAAPSGAAAMPASSDYFPDLAVSLPEAERRARQLKEFVRDQLVDGEDYGLIPGSSAKPALFKAGAEKLNAIFGLAATLQVTSRTEDWDAGFVAYEVKVILINKRTQYVEAEGIGACNSRERRYKNQDAANVANTLLKMARKRALIDATLSATRASGLFTQEAEDPEHTAELRATGKAASNSVGKANGSGARADSRRSAVQPHTRPSADGSAAPLGVASNILTEAQRGAILAIAKRVFGDSSKQEMARLVDKPLTDLSKNEASLLIDRLRALLPEPGPARDESAGATVALNGAAP